MTVWACPAVAVLIPIGKRRFIQARGRGGKGGGLPPRPMVDGPGLPAFWPRIGSFHLRHPELIVIVPALLAELLGGQMPGVLFPGMDRGFIGEIGHCDAEAALP